jgi:hypothetical protein
MKVGPKIHFLVSFMRIKFRIFGNTKVTKIVPRFSQITRQVSAKVKGSVTKVTKATIKMYETMEDEMLIPM